MHKRLPLLFSLVFMMSQSAAADENLTVYFHQRPPYSWLDDASNVVGVVAEPTAKALQLAGIDFTWAAMPSARQMETIKKGDAAACGLGWFKRPDREEFALFSAPIYHDRRMVIVARNNDPRFLGDPRIEDLFKMKELRLLTKTGYSYGATMDEKIATNKPTQDETSTDNFHMLDMVALDRADFMLISAEEADYLLGQKRETASQVTTYPFENAPDGEARYLMCTKLVPQDVLDRFNQALVAQ